MTGRGSAERIFCLLNLLKVQGTLYIAHAIHIISIEVVQDIRGKTARKSMGTSIGPGHGNSNTSCPLPPVISRQKVFQ